MLSRNLWGVDAVFADQDATALIAGVDEAGRGPLAGPVMAAAVMLDAARPIAGLRDSKKLSPTRRDRLFDEICTHALCWAVGEATVAEIGRLNILQATMLAMQRAVAGLHIRPDRVLVDGNRLPPLDLPAEAIIGGDDQMAAIAAASIVAKVRRDRWCLEADRRWPQYGFARHKGYGTAAHLQALEIHGPCSIHRQGFAPVARAARSRA